MLVDQTTVYKMSQLEEMPSVVNFNIQPMPTKTPRKTEVPVNQNGQNLDSSNIDRVNPNSLNESIARARESIYVEEAEENPEPMVLTEAIVSKIHRDSLRI